MIDVERNNVVTVNKGDNFRNECTIKVKRRL